MHALIIGGSSGLGLELAKQLASNGPEVTVTGRTDPKAEKIKFAELDLSTPDLPGRLEAFVQDLPKVNLLVYAAGFYQEGRVTDLSEQQIEDMLNVCGRGLIYSLRALLNKQDDLHELVVITSSSQYTPRKLEPIYNFVKAAERMFANGMAEDERIAKVLVASPTGMKTAFWREVPKKDMTTYLNPQWAAEQIMNYRKSDYKYKEVRLLRDPARVLEVETR